MNMHIIYKSATVPAGHQWSVSRAGTDLQVADLGFAALLVAGLLSCRSAGCWSGVGFEFS